MKRILATVMFMSAVALCQAQTGNEATRQAYEEFRQNARRTYGTFRQKCNNEYIRFLEKAWQRYKCEPPISVPKVVKPVQPKPYDGNKDKPVAPVELPHDEVVPAPVPVPQPSPIEPIKEQPQPIEKSFAFNFYGTEMNVCLTDIHRFRLTDTSELEVASAWRICSQGTFDNVLRDCLALRLRHGLCDWAYMQMLCALGDAFCGHDSNEGVLLAGWLYCQSGYKMKFGRGAAGHLYLLVASRHKIYGTPYFYVDNDNYYPVKCDEKNLEICRALFPQEQPLSLYIMSGIRLDMDATPPRTLQSERYPEMKVTISVNRNLIDFYNNYPTSEISGNFMTRWAMYANAPLDTDVCEKLYTPLRQVIDGLSPVEAANRLLNFVQTAFTYEYDETVWGTDRAFFTEETLFYPYCDCEDRSIFFSRLVRDLLGLPVILVYYPGHLASAVEFPDNVDGDYIMLDGKKFIVCDPTYIGAGIGRTMTGMDNTAAKVILL